MSVNAALTHVSVVGRGQTVDVAVPAGVRIGALLDAAGLREAPGQLIVDEMGNQLGDDALIGVTVTEGQVVVPLGGAADEPAPHLLPGVTQARGERGYWRTLAATASVLIALVAAWLAVAGGVVHGTESILLAGAIVVGSLVTAWVSRGGVALGLAALTAALGAGLVMPPGRGGVLPTCAAVCGAVVLVLAARLTGRPRSQGGDGLGVGVVAAAIVGMMSLAGALASLPAPVVAAVTLGFLPLAQRALPVLCVGIPGTALIDVVKWSQLRATARGWSATDSTSEEVQGEHLVVGASARLRWGRWIIAIMAAILAPLSAAATQGADAHRWAWLSLAGLVGLALLLSARAIRDTPARWASRAAGVAVVGTMAWMCALWWGTDGALAAGCVAASVGVMLLGAAAPVARGIRSLGLSRFADAAEGLATVLALPCALFASGIVDVLRSMTG